MATVKRALSWSLVTAAAVALFLSSAERQPAEAAKIYVEVDKPGGKDLPLSLPTPKGDSSAADQFWRTVWRDLEISGYFHLVDPDAYVESSGAGIEPGTFDYDDWDISDTVVLAKSKLSGSGDKLRSEIWVYDVPGARKLGAKAFSGNTDQVRRLAHKTADEILRQVTGKPGIFNTRFAAVNAGTGNKEIYLVDIDGEGVVQLTRNRSINLSPSWSPGGDRIAFTSYRSGNPDLYIADLNSGRTNRLSSRPGLNTGGAFSPSGGLVALTLTSGGGETDLFTIDPGTGSQVAQLTSGNGIDVSPSWAPGGDRVAFASDRTGGPQIYTMSASGSGAKRVTFQGSYNTDPAWSPSSDTIAYVTRGEDGNFDIMTVAIGEDPVRITQLQGSNEDPTWSPDGRYLAFVSNRTGSNQIWVSTADGRHQTQITRGYGGWSNPSWSPELSW